MPETLFLSESSDYLSVHSRPESHLAPALACVAVVMALIGLSHEAMVQPDFRWPQLSSISRTNSELPAAGHADGPQPEQEQMAGDDAELDALLQGGTRQDKRPGTEAKVREEIGELAVTEPAPSPAPPTVLQDSDRVKLRPPARSAEVAKSDRVRISLDRSDASFGFQPAEGYWSNTYVPGDTEIRLLNARLARWDRSWLNELADLERDVKPVAQPFDAPADNALDLSLMTDVSSVAVADAPGHGTRLRLQVGIQGIEHRRGIRPAMNVGLVVDLPDDTPDDVRIATRALLDAMLQSKQAGDRFSLVLAGSGMVVTADDFRFGSLELVRRRILGLSAGDSASGLSLHDAMEQAGRLVRQSDDPGRPLGSSSVLLISAGSLPDIDRLVELAHAQARDGITLSVFPLGDRPENQRVERLVLAGLGNRRILETPGQARQRIEEELHASSRAVARAARLSIRLSPGVHLIDVIGSERLDAPQAERVREIEISMDRRLSDNLGIVSDRGADEDGIQIVIPSIFSGDSLTVLLDVVVDAPGAIADVSLRYKDLVFLRNGSLQGHLELPGGESQQGQAQRLVMKNRLSLKFSDAVERAAEDLGRKDPAAALARLTAIHQMIDQARQSQAAWLNDPDLIRDQRVLNQYIRALALPLAAAHQSGLADSLHYAAWAKTHRPLEEWNL